MSQEQGKIQKRRLWVRVLAVVGLLLLALVFRGPLMDWFNPQASAPPGPTHPKGPLPDEARAYVQAAFDASEQVRVLLARDTLEGTAAPARESALALREAAKHLGTEEGTEALESGAQAAERLASAQDIEQARRHFGALSRVLVGLAAQDARLREGWHVFECPMVQGGTQPWVQREPKLENPYMGRRMLTCGSASEWKLEAPPMEPGASHPGRSGHEASGHEAMGDEISHYTCPMHPSVRQSEPGQCPICGMELVPVTRAEVESGVIRVDATRRQQIGVRTAPVRTAPMDLSVRALGRITYDETALVDVTLKLDGYVHRLLVDETGQSVRRGETLFTLYSPELYAAQKEFLLALRSQQAAQGTSAPERMDGLVRASRKRLELWGLTESQIDAIARRSEPLENVPFLAPASGYVLEKDIVEGGAVKAGQRLYRLAPLDKVWVEAQVYEQDLPQVRVGQPVEVTLPYLPGRQYSGKVNYIYPSLDTGTRTARLRVELRNPSLELKPDMYADVLVKVEGGNRLQVPASAVVYTGPRRLVFVDLGEGRLAPREVKLGARSGEAYEVLEGLHEGEVVVTSGNFLIAAESRIRSASEQWGGGGSHAGH